MKYICNAHSEPSFPPQVLIFPSLGAVSPLHGDSQRFCGLTALLKRQSPEMENGKWRPGEELSLLSHPK